MDSKVYSFRDKYKNKMSLIGKDGVDGIMKNTNNPALNLDKGHFCFFEGNGKSNTNSNFVSSLDYSKINKNKAKPDKPDINPTYHNRIGKFILGDSNNTLQKSKNKLNELSTNYKLDKQTKFDNIEKIDGSKSVKLKKAITFIPNAISQDLRMEYNNNFNKKLSKNNNNNYNYNNDINSDLNSYYINEFSNDSFPSKKPYSNNFKILNNSNENNNYNINECQTVERRKKFQTQESRHYEQSEDNKQVNRFRDIGNLRVEINNKINNKHNDNYDNNNNYNNFNSNPKNYSISKSLNINSNSYQPIRYGNGTGSNQDYASPYYNIEY